MTGSRTAMKRIFLKKRMAPDWKDYATKEDTSNRGWALSTARAGPLSKARGGGPVCGPPSRPEVRSHELTRRHAEGTQVRLKYAQELSMASGNRLGSLLPGRTGLFAAILIVIVLLIGLPAYRLFFAVSVLLGLGIAGILHLWHKYKPVKEAEVHDNKHPLGLE
jgi:hypothetical protein